jgi:hypothetical protein
MSNQVMGFATRTKEHLTHDGDSAYQLGNNPSELRGGEWDASDTFRPLRSALEEESPNLKHP